MNSSTRLLSLLSPPPLFLLRALRLSNLRRLHRLASPHPSVISPNLRSLSLPVSPPPFIHTTPLGRFHTHRVRLSASDSAPSYHHQLPEWGELLQSLSKAGYFSDSALTSESQKEFFPEFPDELIPPSLACLALARDRPELLAMVSRRDVEVVVENGKPFLFREGPDSLKRMSLYLTSGDILDVDKASTVDLMRLLLSCVVDFASSEGRKHHEGENVKSSVRNLLREIAKMSFRTPESNVHGTRQHQFSGGNGQGLGSFQKNNEMKRGDWICSRCSGMNFARNVKCFQCDEARPKRQLTGSEWECPQCDFYNYGRNIACLRCDCKRPGDVSLNSANSAKDPELERRLVENEEKAQRWFSKVAQGGSDANSVDTDEDFPEIMPLRKGVNRYVVNTRKTPLERRLSNAAETDGTKTNRNLNEILGSTSSFASRSDDKNASSQIVNSGFVPFVPLPSDMFAKKPDKEESLTANNQMMAGVSEDKSSASLVGKETDEPERDEKESEEKPARWLKRITELHSVSDLQEETSPEKMPMRKGENQFVVSRKKDRSLTSPANKRRISVETKDSDFVPFVPFPPDYFAKHKQPKETTTTTTDSIPVPVQEETGEPSRNNPEPMAGKMRNGKSLEGSLVKEPDLLDMSEEAKAERWFKRVAEIKNISELSQIPDEDFPSIMPMRKGVNRFVISKRKTPLERRLASQRQQINPPPITDHDPARRGDTT
ncbi:zinc finger protein VAR3, chloroplastic [Brassica rapa]|uniref:RanBP2-type domain-containing protein n=1 Tax=Brassica campestris TaxID=3711 RepID=M4CQD1_BRACM|nr:zinc finger protein VAR3, chloroplastic [Brassica rapa]